MTRQEVKHAAAVCKTLEAAERMIGRLETEVFKTVVIRVGDFDTATSQTAALDLMNLLRDDMKNQLASMGIQDD